MTSSPIIDVVEHLRRIVLGRDEDAATDSQLLTRFVEERDEVAFAALVRRHGPMVWGVCKRVVGQSADAEDAFQAAFLVLVRKAAAVKPREAVGNWLYGVACNTALKARTASNRVRAREKQVTIMPEPAKGPRDDREELLKVLDRELMALPDKYRLAIVLCELEGRTRKQAAAQLRVPEGTLSSRLSTAHQMLARRLARYGLAVTGGSLAALFGRRAASACVPHSVISSTIRTARLVAVDQGALASVATTKVAALAEGVMKSMLLTKLKIATVALVCLTLLGNGIGKLALPALAEQKSPKNEAKDPADGPPASAKETTQTELQKLHGTWKLVETQTKGMNVLASELPIKQHELVIDRTKIPKDPKAVGPLDPDVGAVVFRFKDGSEDGDIRLDATKKPKEITLQFFLNQWVCIYKLEGDTLTICRDPKDHVRPDEFRTTADSNLVLLVYKRVKPVPAPKKDD